MEEQIKHLAQKYESIKEKHAALQERVARTNARIDLARKQYREALQRAQELFGTTDIAQMQQALEAEVQQAQQQLQEYIDSARELGLRLNEIDEVLDAAGV